MELERSFAVLVVLATSACAQPSSTGPRAQPLPSQPLPSQPPAIHELPFPEGGEWPPLVQGATNVRLVPWSEIPGALTDARVLELREAALRDPRVQEALGARFAYVTADEVEPQKGAARSSAARLTFYSHTNDVAVAVLVRGTEIVQVEPLRGYQPAEGATEIERAVALALSTELSSVAEGLQGTAMAVSPADGRPGAGHRVLYVTFSRVGEARPLYFALVDLTDERVLAYGPVRSRRER